MKNIEKRKEMCYNVVSAEEKQAPQNAAFFFLALTNEGPACASR